MKGVLITAFCLAATTVSAAEIKVLSGGAVETGLEAFAKQVRREMGHELKIQYNTAPQIAKRLAAGGERGLGYDRPPCRFESFSSRRIKLELSISP